MSKKLLSILACAVLILLSFVGCNETKDKNDSANKNNSSDGNSSNTSSNESSDIEAGDIVLPEDFDPEKLPYDGNPIELPEVEV